jgi:hypothetical protein
VSSFRANLAVALSALLLASPAFATRTHKSSASHPSTLHSSSHASGSHASNSHASGSRSHSGRKTAVAARKQHGQQAIEPERVTEIQQALIREHYLSADANGAWDSNTQAAMQKYQADQGWQTKLMPDSRALKKLGLGPDYSNAINAKNATFADPPPVSTLPPTVASGFAQASRVNQ